MCLEMKWFPVAVAGMSAALLAGCATNSCCTKNIVRESFGKMADGTPVDLYTLRNSKGLEARISNYGGTVISLSVPDRDGKFGDIVEGYDSLSGYLTNSPYFGCLVGRYGNRI